ncbi:ABC transporter substrate binding protein [Psychrobacillus sp. NPDC093180]|uniref:ABC transporter substrate-binding protein n=1 Tax=Psychrobacillus sp. NPDC093180 TaxID=3364489 RepID=UPI003816C2C4
MKKLALIIFAAVLFLAACGGESGQSPEANAKEDKKTFKIGVTQIVEHPSLNAAYDGFQKALEDAGLDVEYEVQNAQNDNSQNTTIANNLVSAGVDLIFANSTPSAQAVASVTKDIPIVFTSVTDAVSAELVQSMEQPGGNVTGTVDTQPDAIPSTITFLKDELGAKNVGMVFNAGEQNSRAQVDAVKEQMSAVGLNVVEASVSTSAEVKQATESLIGKVDSLYIITDNTVVSALESVISVANDNKLPMMVGEFDSVKRGGLGAYGFEYFDIGYEAGEMAVKILNGESTPADLPVQYPQNLRFVLNKDTVDALGLEVKDEWKAEFAE